MKENQEEWKAIKGYEGMYEISDNGRVKSLSRLIDRGNAGNYISKEKIICEAFDKNKYKIVKLCKYGKEFGYKVHRLVALQFVPNLENKPQINHKDGNKENNYYENLEWVTNQENINHSVKNHLLKWSCGIDSGKAKLTEKEVIEIFYMEGLYKDIALKFNISPDTVRIIKKKEGWKHLTKNLISNYDGNYMVGEKNSQSKLKVNQVKEIFYSKKSIKELMKEYNVSDSTIEKIKYKLTWKHIVGDL